MSRAQRPPGPPPATPHALGVIERYRDGILSELRAVLAPLDGAPYALMRYHLGWEDREGRPMNARGGKLLRPTLCLLSCEASDSDWRLALPAAAALELLHNFTLIHDDVEDASAERHGRETVWRVWGVAQAINAGDGMLALAHATLLQLGTRTHPPQRILRAAGMLDNATLRLCAGQHRDLVSAGHPPANREEYLSMIEGKTASLLAACSGIGALLGGANDETVTAMEEFGRRLGFAFQIRDDVLGIWGLEQETGKPASDDLRNGKRSFPVVVALESSTDGTALASLLGRAPTDDQAAADARTLLERLGAREESEHAAREEAEAAVASLEGLPLQAERRAELQELARFAAQRHA